MSTLSSGEAGGGDAVFHAVIAAAALGFERCDQCMVWVCLTVQSAGFLCGLRAEAFKLRLTLGVGTAHLVLQVIVHMLSVFWFSALSQCYRNWVGDGNPRVQCCHFRWQKTSTRGCTGRRDEPFLAPDTLSTKPWTAHR
jgi:hypothetical protein